MEAIQINAARILFWIENLNMIHLIFTCEKVNYTKYYLISNTNLVM